MCEDESAFPFMHIYGVIDIAIIFWMLRALQEHIALKGAKRIDSYAVFMWISGTLNFLYIFFSFVFYKKNTRFQFTCDITLYVYKT